MNNRKILVIFLALAAIFAFTPFVLPIQAQAGYESAWLKVVTPSWNRAATAFSPLPDTATGGVADRFNVTNALVELSTNMPAAGGSISLGAFHTNGTGFVQIKWPKTYGGFEVTNLTLFIHWKDTQIYIYNLTIGCRYDGTTRATLANQSKRWDGTRYSVVYSDPREIEQQIGKLYLSWFASNFSSPSKAFVAHAAVIFKDIQTFYADGITPLGNTVIRVYENFITDQSSTESLIYAGTADSTGLLESIPIPLNLTGSGLAYPNLNGSIAVWWETVLVGFENHTYSPPQLPFRYGLNASIAGIERITCNVNNATWIVKDNATTVQPLWGARIKVNVLPTNYLMHVWYLTDSNGRANVILPNATDGLAYCYNPLDMVVIDTATFEDDVEFSGLGIEVEWKGGKRNAYGGSWVLVNYTFLEVPADVWYSTYGAVNVTASVYDVAFKVVDALGTPVDGAYVTVYRQNGPPITEELPGKPLVTGHSEADEPVSGFVFLHQLPGKLTAYGGFSAIYGVKVVYEGVGVFYNASIFNGSLTGGRLQGLPTQGTTFKPWWGGDPEPKTFPYMVLNASIFKVKVHLADCNLNGLPYVTVNYTHPIYGAVQDTSDGDGNIDLVAVPGTYKFTGAYFKSTWASVVKGNDTIVVSKNVNVAITVKFNIADIILTFYDADKEVTIPNLNATLSWLVDNTVFEEKTMNATLPDGTPYTVYRDATRTKVIFKQMPTAVYNITVHTRVDAAGKENTPGKVYWSAKRLVYFEAFKDIVIDCSNVNLDILTWAYDWTLDVINGLVPLANVTVYVTNDEGKIMGTWVTDETGHLVFNVEQANYQTDTVSVYTTKRIWWNGTYTIDIEYDAAFGYHITEVYNASVTNQTADFHKFKLQENDHKELLKVPVGDIIVKATDKCGKPLFGKFDNATVELTIWTNKEPLHYELEKVNETGHVVWLHVPTAGWLNATQMDEANEVIKNFTLRILWYNRSAVVFEKVWNMTKEGFKGGESEVYNITFVTAICKNPDRPVKNLNVTLYWTNATGTNVVYPKWWNGTAWITDPAEGKMPWKEGKWTFVMIPGPRYFNVSDAYYHVHVYNDEFEDTGITELAYPGSMGTELSDLYWDPVEKEWLPYVPHCIFSGKEFKVGIKLNATDIEASALTWRREEYKLAKYPVVGYVVEAEVTTPLDVTLKFSGVTGPDGTITFKSGSTIDTVIWNGSIINSMVIKPSDDLQTPASDLWLKWMEAHVGKAKEKFMVTDFEKKLYPMEGAILKLSNETLNSSLVRKLLFVNVTENVGNIHVPHKINANYTAVTVRVTDFNGRPLPGAFVELIELSSRRVSSWSYTNATGDTVIMNVTAGWPTVDFNNYIIRVSYLGYVVKEDNVPKDTIPFWPAKFTTKINMPVVYDTWEDEPEHKWIKVYNEHGWYKYDPYVPLPDCGKHSDVISRVFDMRIRFYYETSVPATVYVDFLPPSTIAKSGLPLDAAKLFNTLDLKAPKGEGLLIMRCVRGAYGLSAYHGYVYEKIGPEKAKDYPVYSKTFDVSQVNVGTIYWDIQINAYSLGNIYLYSSPVLVGRTGTPLSGAEVSFRHIETGLGFTATTDSSGAIPMPVAFRDYGLPGGVYHIEAKWTNYKKIPLTVFLGDYDLVKLKEVGKIQASVYDIKIKLVDGKARPIQGATVKLDGIEAPMLTDVEGITVFMDVPCEAAGTTYDISAEKEGKEIAKTTIMVSPAKIEFTILGGLYDLRVQVVGAAGQGLPSSTVVVKRAGVPVATLTTDPNGIAVVPQLVASDYDVEVLYKGFSGSASISASDLAAGKAVVISLPPYAEVFGIVLTYWTFLAIVIGIILLVIVLVVLLSEYITWRRRKLGIYLPPPPKKEEK
jgi:hypothetical protein